MQLLNVFESSVITSNVENVQTWRSRFVGVFTSSEYFKYVGTYEGIRMILYLDEAPSVRSIHFTPSYGVYMRSRVHTYTTIPLKTSRGANCVFRDVGGGFKYTVYLEFQYYVHTYALR